MTDAPTPPAPAPTPSPTPEPPRRARTFLGRLATALRRQDWVAVVLEVAIVVIGVVIGFQVTAWGQERSDRVREQDYLRQLAEDLRETERQMLRADSVARPLDAASTQLVQAYFTAQRPPADSVLRWRLRSMRYAPLVPVTGTADALIASGDLALIRSDSLRSEITAYVPYVRTQQAEHGNNVQLWWAESVALANRYDVSDVLARTMSAEAIDSMAVGDPFSPLPAGERRRPFPVDVETMLTDREAYNHLRGMLEHKWGMHWNRRFVREATRDLLRQVEAELDR